jgi:hypothetical protein
MRRSSSISSTRRRLSGKRKYNHSEARGAYAAKCSAILMSTCGKTSELHLAIGTAAATPTP